jgi:hypothetical protein
VLLWAQDDLVGSVNRASAELDRLHLMDVAAGGFRLQSMDSGVRPIGGSPRGSILCAAKQPEGAGWTWHSCRVFRPVHDREGAGSRLSSCSGGGAFRNLVEGLGGEYAPRATGIASGVIEIPLSRAKLPDQYRQIVDVENTTGKLVYTHDPSLARPNRLLSLRGTPVRRGYDRGEWPPAATREGGRGADVRHISPTQNRSIGASIGNRLRRVPPGTQWTIQWRL